MNWVSRSTSQVEIRRLLSDERSDLCEHVQRDRNTAFGVLKEDDSFGPVVRYICCTKCYAEDVAEEGAELVHCVDCKQKVPRKNTIAWRWYDFYAPQGDEPLIVCEKCSVRPEHLQRVRSDAAAARAEVSYYDE